MPDLSIPRQKRIAAGILGILMLFIMLFSAFYIAAEANHDCTGEDCPICACIGQCENTLHQIGGGTASHSAIIIPVVFVLVSAILFSALFSQETPVSRKVRLNH